jgi:hypothetical protein
MNAAFYGEERTVSEILRTLTDLTGSAECAEEFVRVCDEIEAASGPDIAFSQMPSGGWVN